MSEVDGDQMVWVASGTKSCYHTDRYCSTLAKAKNPFRKPLSAVDHLQECGHCRGQKGGGGGQDLIAKLEQQNPEDYGLSPIGKGRARTDGGERRG